MRAFPIQSNEDNLKYCGDLWWWFHEADADSGFRSSMGGQIAALELGTNEHHAPEEPEVMIDSARKNRRMCELLKPLSERHYGLLRQWYTELRHDPSEVAVAEAHQAFYSIRGR